MRRVAVRHHESHTLGIITSSNFPEGCVDHRQKEIAALKQDWASNTRWSGIKRGYSAEDVVRLRGSLKIEHTLARHGAEKLWRLCNERL